MVGARQTGKTTLLARLKEEIVLKRRVDQRQIKIYNLDLIKDLEEIGDQTAFIEYLRDRLRQEKRLYVFIDEVQRLENPGRYIKGIYDLGWPIKFVLTGSSSLEIKSKVFESLTGRKKVFHVWPFSFLEYLSCLAPKLAASAQASAIAKKEIQRHFKNYLVFGGYPKVVLAKSKQERLDVIKEIFSNYVEKDIVGFMKIKYPMVFSKLVALAANQIGSLINLNEISNTLAIDSRTIESYLEALANTYIVNLLRPYYSNARKELTKMPKVYFTDNGLRNLAANDFAPFDDNRDKGRLLENHVFSVLSRLANVNLNYWRTKDKSEVDFVLRDYYGQITPIEVKAAQFKKPEITRSLRAFIEKYKPAKALIINLALEDKIKVGRTAVKFILPYDLKEALALK